MIFATIFFLNFLVVLKSSTNFDIAALAALGSGLADSETQEMLQMAIVFHLAVLVLFKLGAFLVLTLIEIDGGGNKISDLHGLARRDPVSYTHLTLPTKA